MKVAFRIGIVVIGVVLAAGAYAQAPNLARMDVVERCMPDGPVAFVDGAPVSRSSFRQLYRNRVLEIALQLDTEDIGDRTRVQIGIDCLRELLEREILSKEAVRRQLTVTEEEVAGAYQAKLKLFREGLSAPGEAEPDEAAVLQFAGQTKDEAIDSIRRALLANKVWEALAEERGVAVTDDEISEFYKGRPELFRTPAGVHLEQIFARPRSAETGIDEASWLEAKARAEKALARIRAGESFAAVARDMSDSPDRDKGGDIGMIHEDQLPGFMAEAARALKPGELSSIVRSRHGWHLFRLVEREDSVPISLEVASRRIEAVLRDVKTQAIVAEFCQPVLADPARVSVFLLLREDLVNPPEEQAKSDAS